MLGGGSRAIAQRREAQYQRYRLAAISIITGPSRIIEKRLSANIIIAPSAHPGIASSRRLLAHKIAGIGDATPHERTLTAMTSITLYR